MTGLADRVPRWARIIPGAFSAFILGYRLGFIRMEAITSNFRVDSLALGIGLAAAISIPVATLLHGRRKQASKRPDNTPLCHVHKIWVEDPSAGQTLVRLIERRSKGSSAINYVLASVSGRIGSGNFLFVCGAPPLVEREVDILEASISVMGDGLRIEKVGYINHDFSQYLPSSSRGGDPSFLLAIGSRPESVAAGRRLFRLGYRIDTPIPDDVYVYEADVAGHIGVFGSTGAGKSTTLRKIFSQLPSTWGATIVLDWTGEHSELAPSQATVYRPYRGEAGLNPLDTSMDLMVVLDIISSALGLTDPQSYMLLSILSSERPRSFEELYSRVLEWEESSKWDREVKRALARKLSSIISDIDAFRDNSAQTILSGQSHLSIIDLSGFRSVRGKRAYSLSLLALAYHTTARSRSKSRLAVIVDEAHNVFESDSIIAETIASEARKFGLSLVYATQSPSHIHNRIILNTNTKIVHSLRSLQDKEYIARSMSIDGRLASRIDKLAPGEAVLQSPSNPEPILVKVEV